MVGVEGVNQSLIVGIVGDIDAGGVGDGDTLVYG
jgi:hypothetical protein